MENQENMNNDEPLGPFMNKAVGKNALNFGLLTGAALILFSFILYVLDATFQKNVSNFSFLLLIGGIIYGIWYYKKKVNDGFLTVGKGIATGTLIALYAGILSSLFMIIMMVVIDPGMVDRMMEMAEEEMLRRNPDLGDAEYDMGMGILERFSNPYFMTIVALFWYVIAGLIVSLITSAIMKKEPETIS